MTREKSGRARSLRRVSGRRRVRKSAAGTGMMAPPGAYTESKDVRAASSAFFCGRRRMEKPRRMEKLRRMEKPRRMEKLRRMEKPRRRENIRAIRTVFRPID